jgi:hypothetical protein
VLTLAMGRVGCQQSRWIPGCVPARAICRSFRGVCWDSTNGDGSRGACLRVPAIAPSGACVGIPTTVLDPLVRAFACPLSLLRVLASGVQQRCWISGCVLARASQEHVSFRALALGLPNREVLIRDSWEHVSFRAVALGLPNREVLYVTVRSTFRLGR